MGWRNSDYISTKLNAAQVKSLAQEHHQYAGYADDADYGYAKIPLRILSQDALLFLISMFKGTGDTGSANMLTGYLNTLLRPNDHPITSLRGLEPAFTAWLKNNLIRGWIFDVITRLPSLVTDVRYTEPDDDLPACVVVSTTCWEKNYSGGSSLCFHGNDISNKKSVTQLMLEHGWVHETQELIAEHDQLEKLFLEYKDQTGRQFVCDGSRVVVDFNHRPKPVDIEVRAANRLLVGDGASVLEEEQCSRVPIHPYLWAFDLMSHRFKWCPVKDMTPYQYTSGLKQSLVLPEEHTDLIDALLTDLTNLSEDVVENKTGGMIVLCQGSPGTGKTLTSEVYSEETKKPLLRVHSGQLGTTPVELEKRLRLYLSRAERWNAILLIDEADVFLMQRGANLARNAVVGSFLRVLEYYRGVLFLTTNRWDDIDHAILSRCIAIIKYSNPTEPQRLRIWKTQCGLNGMALSDTLIKRLACSFECSGRDIRGLVRLTAIYCNTKNKQPEFDDFKRLATFRGMSVIK